MNKKNLRIVILNYNQAKMTLKCVNSVLAQSYSPIEIVVVDNHSDESDFEYLSRVLPAEAKLLRTDSNLGYARGNNAGVKMETGSCPEYIMILNNDVLLNDVRTCEKLTGTLQHDELMVACSPLVFDPKTMVRSEQSVQVRRIPNYLELLVCHSWWLKRLPLFRRYFDRYTYADRIPFPLNSNIHCESINGCCFVVRKTFLDVIQNLDEGTFLYNEELILGWQIKNHGKKACLNTSTVVLHNHGTTTGHRHGRINFHMIRHMVISELYFCTKYLTSSRLAVAMLILIRGVDITGQLVFDLLKRTRFI